MEETKYNLTSKDKDTYKRDPENEKYFDESQLTILEADRQ